MRARQRDAVFGRALRHAALACALASWLVACGSDRLSDGSERAFDAPCLREPLGSRSSALGGTLRRLLAYLEREENHHPHALAMEATVQRWFGGAALSKAVRRYDSVLRAQPELAFQLQILRRFVDPKSPAPASGWERLGSHDVFTAAAAYCDVRALPPNFATQLQAEAEAGEYRTTHAGLAYLWIASLGCKPALPASFAKQLGARVARLVDSRAPVTDLDLEAAATAQALGAGELLPRGFVEQVLRAQHASGGFAGNLPHQPPGQPDWHASVVALMYLTQHACPVRAPRSLTAGVSRPTGR